VRLPATLLVTVAVVAGLAPRPRPSSSSTVHKIGFLGVRADAENYSGKFIRQELHKLGYLDGKNIRLEARSADNQLERLPSLVNELLRLKMDVLITAATRELYVARDATKDVTLISLNLGDPVASGLVQSLARPGGNITGFAPLSVELMSKRLELLKQTVRKTSRIAVLFHPQTTSPATWENGWRESQRVAPGLGIDIHPFAIKAAHELPGVFRETTKIQADGVAVSLSPLINSLQRKIVDLAASRRLPAIYPRGDFAESGGLMSYGADRNEPYARVAAMVDKVLKGVMPANLPVEQPRKFELVINLKAARQIDLTIPPNVLARADRVIKRA